MAGGVQVVPGSRLAVYAEGIRAVYADAFGEPPWEEAPALADAYLVRLTDDARRPGFRAALALDEGAVAGPCSASWPRRTCPPRRTASRG